MDRDKLRALVKSVLDEMDVEGLFSIGAPKDEYNAEANTIAEAILRGRQVTPDLIRDVWLYWFGYGESSDGVVHVLEMPMRTEFATVAERISIRMERAQALLHLVKDFEKGG